MIGGGSERQRPHVRGRPGGIPDPANDTDDGLPRRLRRLPPKNDPVAHLCDPPKLMVNHVAVTDLRVFVQAS